MEAKPIELSIKEIERISRRMNMLNSFEKRANSSLCNAADRCWENVNAEENYERYLDKIGASDKRLELLDEIRDSINNLHSKLQHLKDLI